MKKKSIKIGVLLSLSIMLLTGCSNKEQEEYVKQGKVLLAQEEYEKAKNMFMLANEEKETREVNNLINQIDYYQDIMKMYENKDLALTKEIEEMLKLTNEALKISSSEIIHIKLEEIEADLINLLDSVSIVENQLIKEEQEVKDLIASGEVQDAHLKAITLSEKVMKLSIEDERYKPYNSRFRSLEGKVKDELYYNNLLDDEEYIFDPNATVKADEFYNQ